MSKSSLILTPVQAVGCCSPLTQEPISANQAERIAPLLKALADPVRLRLLSLVASRETGEACVCDLNDAFDLSQPTISHHLKVLHEAGLLDRAKRGVWVFYQVRREALSDLAVLLGGPGAGSREGLTPRGADPVKGADGIPAHGPADRPQPRTASGSERPHTAEVRGFAATGRGCG